MIENHITILINRKSDARLIKNCIIESNIESPVYIYEYEKYFRVKITSNYEEWELEKKILNSFPKYEFTESLGSGRKEIRLQFSRYQSPYSIDGWSRPIEDPVNETKYLIKKTEDKVIKFNPKVVVLFEDHQQDYYINIVDGINKRTDEKGFLLVNEFKLLDIENKGNIFQDRLYQSPIEAFHFASLKMDKIVKEDFQEYLKEKKKEKRRREKIPRKIVRDFIKACNKSDSIEILKNLDKNFVYEIKIKHRILNRFIGIKNFLDYIGSVDQNILNKGFKIRSKWTLDLPSKISIDVKYLPNPLDNNTKTQVYRELTFWFENDKVIQITENRRE